MGDKMEDECSIEDLTAFLEACDSEDEDSLENVTNTTKDKQEKTDEIGDEDIQAFLEASDDEDGEGSVKDHAENEGRLPEQNSDSRAEQESDFDEMDEAELDELDLVESQNLSGGNISVEPFQEPEENHMTSNSPADVVEKSDGDRDVGEAGGRDSKTDVTAEMAAMAEKIKKLEAMLAEKGKAADEPRQASTTSKSSTDSKHIGDLKHRKQAKTTSGKVLQQPFVKAEDPDDNPFFLTLPQPSAEARPSSDTAQNVVDAKSLFGESDDSDWEELDGGEKCKLSDEGQELKKLLNAGPRKREAHTPSYDPAILKKPNMKGWNETKSPRSFLTTSVKSSQPDKPAINPETGTVSGKYQLREEYRPRPAVIQKEDERASVTDPFCGIRIINPRISMEEFRQKMAGRTMVKIPRLLAKTGMADLQKDNWVTLGVVVHKTEPRQSANGKTYCIWKLTDLQNCDKTVTFFLFGNVYKEHWKNDLGIVVGLLNPSLMDKAEKAQSEVAFTISHPGQMLVLGISKDLGRCRGVTKSGQPCSSFINKTQGEYCTYHVQAAYRRSSSKRTELQASTGVVPKAFEQKKQNNKSGFFFYGGNTFTSMKPQAKSAKDKMSLQKLQTFEAGKAAGKVTTMSLHELEPKDKARLAKLEEKDKQLLELLSVPTAGSMNFVKHLVKNKDSKQVAQDGSKMPVIESVSATDLLKQHRTQLQQKKQGSSRADPLRATPQLGRGFSTGQDISLEAPVKKVKGTAAAELAKQLAIAKVKAKGGIEKEDPNAVRKKLTSPEAKEKIKKRVADDMDTDDGTPGQNKQPLEPPRKRSKFLGDLDLNSAEVQSLLKAKSKHTGALAEAEAEHEEKYFSALEQKEKMEDKMAAIMEVPVTLFVCLQCKYKYFSVHERCKKENHVIKKVKGTKRFFKCKQCKRRTVSVERLPTTACKDCGSSNFERVSMLKERSGPKLESEELCIRGNEQKFVGSLQGKTYLNV